MKRVVLMVLLVMFVSACGGGGDTSNTASPSETPAVTGGGTDEPATEDPTTEGSALPEIVDNYYDSGSFTYKDVSLYEGSYLISAYTAETCSAFFSIPWQTSMTFSAVTDTDLDLLLEGNPYTFTTAAAGDMGANDMLGYGGLYRGLGCAVAVASFTVSDETYDIIGFACVTDDHSDSCGAVYERTSEYDFSTTALKSAGAADSLSAKIAEFLSIVEAGIAAGK